jgi:hypothetical protein
VLHVPISAPQSAIAPERRGEVVGRFCRGCQAVYSTHAPRHSGKPVFGRDHVASTCPYEGRAFDADAPWWEPAVAVLPLAAAAPAPAPAGAPKPAA